MKKEVNKGEEMMNRENGNKRGKGWSVRKRKKGGMIKKKHCKKKTLRKVKGVRNVKKEMEKEERERKGSGSR